MFNREEHGRNDPAFASALSPFFTSEVTCGASAVTLEHFPCNRIALGCSKFLPEGDFKRYWKALTNVSNVNVSTFSLIPANNHQKYCIKVCHIGRPQKSLIKLIKWRTWRVNQPNTTLRILEGFTKIYSNIGSIKCPIYYPHHSISSFWIYS